MHYALIVTATLSLLHAVHAVHAALLIGGLLAASAYAQTQARTASPLRNQKQTSSSNPALPASTYRPG